MEMVQVKNYLVIGLKKRNREDFVIATKVRFRTGTEVNEAGLSRKHILAGIERSLSNLQTTYIDLYQAHHWDTSTPLEETLSTFNELVRSGKVRYIGVSNWSGWQLQKGIEISRRLGLEKIICLQPQYHLLQRAVEWELVPVCLNEGVGIIPWSPLASGILSGKYKRGEPVDSGSRTAWADKMGFKTASLKENTDHIYKVLDAVGRVADETKHTYAQVALRWLLQKPAVVAPIIGARTLEQLEENLGAGTFSLTPAQIKSLDEASEIPFVIYPYTTDAWALEVRDNPKWPTKFEVAKVAKPEQYY